MKKVVVHTTKKQREKRFKNTGNKILCANIYNNYKCWKNTWCCEYLKDNTKCPAMVKIPERKGRE
jgi:hypothetical protein